MEHPIGSLMDTTMEKIKEMIDVNTIIGEPITSPDGTLIIPVSKVSYGFAAGGSDLPTKKENKDCFGGGSGAGVTIQPVAFLTVYQGDVRLVSVDREEGTADKPTDKHHSQNHNNKNNRYNGFLLKIRIALSPLISSDKEEKRADKHGDK